MSCRQDTHAVTLRFSDSEYELLKTLAMAAGARGIADFLRRAVFELVAKPERSLWDLLFWAVPSLGASEIRSHLETGEFPKPLDVARYPLQVAAGSVTAEAATPELRTRRAQRRFPIRLGVSAHMMLRGEALTLRGMTSNISANGIQFTTIQPTTTGDVLLLSIDWPMQSRLGMTMRLTGHATVKWTIDDLVGARVHHWEFREGAIQFDQLPVPGAEPKRE